MERRFRAIAGMAGDADPSSGAGYRTICGAGGRWSQPDTVFNGNG